MLKQWKVGILLFDEVEVLDFAGPFEVFSLASYAQTETKPFMVRTISQVKEPVRARNGLQILPDFCFRDNPSFDIVIIPGGYGAEEIEIHNEVVIDWIKEQVQKVELLASVCTGAFLLAKAGLLDGKKATTHWMDLDRLEKEFPLVEVQRGQKFVDQGKIITSAGISAGIDMSFYIIGKLLGDDIARLTARRMEYDCSVGT